MLAGYFDEAHRGLQRSQSTPKVGPGPSVNLPPLRPNSGPPAPGGGDSGGGGGGGYGGGGGDRDIHGWEKVMSSSLHESKSFGSLDFLVEHTSMGLQSEQYHSTLQENAKLARKVRALQDQLAITSAKKEAFKAQAQRLEREFRKGRDQTDSLQKDLLEARREAGQVSKEAQDAVGMMTEMRRAHISEVKLLQRGLQARGNNESTRNRVNEMADLVDKVGRAVVQRDEAIRDRTKMEAQLNKVLKELRSSADESSRLKRANKKLSDDLKEAKRRGQYTPPVPAGSIEEDSDHEFEVELQMFEQRFEILEEGPAGLDVLASNLSKDKQELEKKNESQQQTIRSLNTTIENWKRLGAEKDQQIKNLSTRIEKMVQDQKRLEEQIAAKQREIAQQVEEERSSLEARIAELELECDNARSAADGMEKASNRLTRELVKVHEAYTGGAPPAPAVAVSKAEVLAKTGEKLKLEVFKDGDKVELRATELPDGTEEKVPISAELMKQLDQADPWTELFARTGIDPGPPRRIVVSQKLAEKEVPLGKGGASVLMTAYRYSAKRYYLAGMDLSTQQMMNLAISEKMLTPALQAKLDACTDDAKRFDALVAAVRLEGGSLKLAA